MIQIPSNYFRTSPRPLLYAHKFYPWTVSSNIGAYLLYTDRGDFNRFLFSGPMLDLYRYAHPYLVPGNKWMEVFHEKRWGNTDEWRNYSDITEEYSSEVHEAYSKEHKEAASLALADMLRTGYQMVEQFSKSSVVEKQLLTHAAVTAFWKIQDQVQRYNAADYKAPVLGP